MEEIGVGKCYPPDRHIVPKWRRVFAIAFLMLFYQLPFFAVTFILLYGIFTINFKILATLVLISILQLPFRKSDKFVEFILKFSHPYLYFRKVQKYYEETIQENSRSLFAFHPHSILGFSLTGNLNLRGDPMCNMVSLSSRFILNMPITGLMLKLWGMQSVDPGNINRLMNQGKTIGLLPGGFEQATITTPKELRVFIKQRAGFIKYALKHGYTIYPTLVLNEHQAFWTFDYFNTLRLMLNKLKLPGCFFFGPYGIFMPPNIDYITVVGKGIRGSPSASKTQINRIHQEYIQEIQRLYNKYKVLNNNVPMIIY